MMKMMKWLAALPLMVSLPASAQCFSPGGPCESPAESAGPAELCFPTGCRPVVYTTLAGFVIAESALPNGYSILGWSGPCLDATCPEQAIQAYEDLWINARRAARAQRAVAK